MNTINEMKQHFKKRTMNHIQLVQRFSKLFENYMPTLLKGLHTKSIKHDLSKFKEPEIKPYILLTWDYKCKREGKDFKLPANIKEIIHQATLHHIMNNEHHPEFWASNKEYVEILNKDDRDKPPKEIIDATNMPNLALAEMVADWCAMSKELCGKPSDWAKKNIGVRWEFTPKQIRFINALINYGERRMNQV